MRNFIFLLLLIALFFTACSEEDKNNAPQVDAGVDQTISITSNSIRLNPSVSDDGLPEGSTLSFYWIVQSVQNNVTFDDHNSKQPTVTFDAVGVYELELSVSDGKLSSSDSVVITVTDETTNIAPQVNAGVDQAVSLSAIDTQLTPTVSDDDLPEGATLSYTWAQKSGEGTVTFSDASIENPTVTFDAIGVYELELSVSDGELSASDTITITVADETTNIPPQVEAGVDQTVSLSATDTQLTPTVSDDDLPEGATLTYTWAQKSGEGTATFSDASIENPTVSFDALGMYELELTVSDGELSASDTVSIIVEESVITACGNDVIDPGEACDGTDLGDFTLPAGYKSGELACMSDCTGFTVENGEKGTTWTVSCDKEEIQDAIDNKASSGDTIEIQPGECTWADAGISIPSDKNLIIKGAGCGTSDQGADSSKDTIIANSTENSFMNLNYSASRVTGIRLVFNEIADGIVASGKNWRIDNCYFERSSIATEWEPTVDGVFVNPASANGNGLGIIDHCYFENARVRVHGSQLVAANHLWDDPLNLGTNNAIFVEDCQLTRAGARVAKNVVDANYGGRYVFRNNTVTDAYIEVHGVQGYNRSARSWEIYNNTIIRDDLSWGLGNPPFRLRGGTGVVFNNDIKGAWEQGTHIGLDIKRNNDANLVNCICGGDPQTLFSQTWDGDGTINGELVGVAGYPCRDQIGTSTDSSFWEGDPDITTPWNSAKWSNPAYKAPIQDVDPACEWDNTNDDGTAVDFRVLFSSSDDFIQEGRDFKSDTKREGYVSYPYPHPLVKLEQQ